METLIVGYLTVAAILGLFAAVLRILDHDSQVLDGIVEGALVGFVILLITGQDKILTKQNYEALVNKPAEKVYVDRCWTIDNKEYCGEFVYENEKFQLISKKDGPVTLNIK